MRLRELMTTEIETVDSTSTVKEAAVSMKAWNVGALPVCENDRTVGIITDRDIVVRAVAEGLDPEKTRVRDAMTKGVMSCHQDEDVETAAELMRKKKIRRVIVEDGDGIPIGIVSLGDLAVYSHDEPMAEQVLEEISK